MTLYMYVVVDIESVLDDIAHNLRWLHLHIQVYIYIYTRSGTHT